MLKKLYLSSTPGNTATEIITFHLFFKLNGNRKRNSNLWMNISNEITNCKDFQGTFWGN